MIANYRDPFLGKGASLDNHSTKGNRRHFKERTKDPSIPVDSSFIAYLGSIRNQKNKKKVSIVRIGGKEHMVTEGALVENVKVIKSTREYMIVSYRGKTRYLKRQ